MMSLLAASRRSARSWRPTAARWSEYVTLGRPKCLRRSEYVTLGRQKRIHRIGEDTSGHPKGLGRIGEGDLGRHEPLAFFEKGFPGGFLGVDKSNVRSKSSAP